MRKNRHFREMTWEEAHVLQNKLIRIGYPAQIFWADKRWKVLVEGMPISKEMDDVDLI